MYRATCDRRTARRTFAMRRLIGLLAASGLTLFGLAALSGPAAGSIAPGTNGKIAFYRDGQGVITIDPDGTHEHQIGTDAQGYIDLGTWSPDSSKLLLADWLPGAAPRPATANPDGTDFTLLDASRRGVPCGHWSPDGTRLLCQASENTVHPKTNGLYTLRSSDGGGLKQIVVTRPPGDKHIDIPIGYSPDGTEILFNREHKPSHLGRLFVVHPDGTGLTRITPFGLLIREEDCGGVSTDWSPDGSQVTFAASLRSGKREGTAVFVMNSDGTGLHRVTPYGANGIAGAAWSPDGTTIVFSAAFLTRHHLLWSVHPDGTGLSELTPPSNGDSACSPVWSPNGAKIAFMSFHPEISGGQEDLWSIRSDGTGLFQITDTPGYENNPQWGSAPVG